MENSVKELGKIRDSIIYGKISENKLRNQMDKLKNEYGESVFKNYDLNSVRQYVYTKEYYERLVQLAKNGACSQEFYIHLIRVRDSIKKQNLIRYLSIIFASFFLIILLATFRLTVRNHTMIKKVLNNYQILELQDKTEINNDNSEENEIFTNELEIEKLSGEKN